MPAQTRFETAAQFGQLIGPWAVVVVLLGIAVLPLIPPRPAPADAPLEQFSALRASEHVAVIAREPHPIGSPANAAVLAYLVDQIEAMGLEPVLQPVEVPDYYRGAGTITIVNVMTRIPGRSSVDAIALMGHYDSTPATPGANDNAAAAAAILETARALLAGPPLQNDVILLFTDGEEPPPRYGASAFVDQHPWADDIQFIVNFEATGGAGVSALLETGGPQSWSAGEIVAGTPRPVAFSFYASIAELFGGADTDFAPFREQGIPGANFAFMHGSSIYHTSADTLINLNLGGLQQHGLYALSIAQKLGDTDLSAEPEGHDAVYFNIGSTILAYRTSWVLPLALIASLVFGAAAVRQRTQGHLSFRSTIVAAGLMMLAITLAAVIALFAWRILTSIRSTPDVAESYAYLGGLFVLLLVPCLLVAKRFDRKHRRLDLFAGVVLGWLFIGVAASVALPGASYLFIWPALAGSIALGWLPTGPRLWQRLLALALVTAPAFILAVPAVDWFFQLAVPRPGNPDSDLPEVIVAPVMLTILMTALIWAAWHSESPGRRRTPVTDGK